MGAPFTHHQIANSMKRTVKKYEIRVTPCPQWAQYVATAAPVCIRRLYPMRRDPEAVSALQGWIQDLRLARRATA